MGDNGVRTGEDPRDGPRGGTIGHMNLTLLFARKHARVAESEQATDNARLEDADGGSRIERSGRPWSPSRQTSRWNRIPGAPRNQLLISEGPCPVKLSAVTRIAPC